MITRISSGGSNFGKHWRSLVLAGVLLAAPAVISQDYQTIMPFTSVAQAGVVEDEAAEKQRMIMEDARQEYSCALAAAAVYNNDLNQAVRSELEHMGWRFQQVKMKNSRADTTFFLIQRVEPDGSYSTILSIPGTEKIKDMEVDLRMGRVIFGGSTPSEFEAVASKNLYQEVEKSGLESDDFPTVHRGFNDYVQTAFFTPDEEGRMGMDYLIGPLKAKNSKLYITGHSLGGAASIILAARLSTMKADPEKLEVLTYGSPAVGNEKFAKFCEGKFRLRRMVINKDPIVGVLQGITNSGSVFTQFGEKVQWYRNYTTERGHHEMAVYLDAAIRNYYDIWSGKQDNDTKSDIIHSNKDSIWSGTSRNGQGYRVYLAPVELHLHGEIQRDGGYMRYVVKDMLVNQLRGAVADVGETSDLADTCKKAEEMGCQYVIFEKISGELEKTSRATYHLSIDEMIYDVTGQLITTQSTSTTTSRITPIEAVMYGIARGNETRQNAVNPEVELHYKSIFE